MVQGTSQDSLASPLQLRIAAIELMIFVPSDTLIFAAQTRVQLSLGAGEASHGINMAYLPRALTQRLDMKSNLRCIQK